MTAWLPAEHPRCTTMKIVAAHIHWQCDLAELGSFQAFSPNPGFGQLWT
jgi:hypothetical protein